MTVTRPVGHTHYSGISVQANIHDVVEFNESAKFKVQYNIIII